MAERRRVEIGIMATGFYPLTLRVIRGVKGRTAAYRIGSMGQDSPISGTGSTSSQLPRTVA